MAKAAGRKLKLEYSIDSGTTYTLLASVREKSINKASEPIDVSTDDSDAHRTLLAEPASRSVDISVSGVSDDEYLMTQISAATASLVFEYIRVTYPDGATDTGTFFLNSLSRTGSYQDAVTFEASLQSSGVIVYAAAP
jgi:TP901-1 family phage major tail protein